MLRDHPIDDAVVPGLFGGHEVVALGVVANLVVLLLRVLRDDVVEALADVDYLLGVDLDVRGLALEAGADLVDEDLRVGQRHAFALRPAGQQQRAHRHRDADADRLHVGLDEVHRVVDRQARVHRPAGRVDVDRDVLVGILGLQVQELGHDQVGDLIVHGRAEEDDALVQEAAVDVERTLPTGGLLDNHRYEWAHGPRFVSLRTLESFRWLTARAAPLGRRLATAWARQTRVFDQVARSGFWLLDDRNRLRRLREQVQGLALRQIVLEAVEASIGAQALQQLLRRRLLA